MFRFFSRGKLTILVFHKVPVEYNPLSPQELGVERFEKILDVAARRFTVLPLDEALNLLRSDRLPDQSACITFDDGYADWRHGALPVLKKYGLHATFFLTTGQFFGTPVWTERILHAMSRMPNDNIPLGAEFSGISVLACKGVEEKAKSVLKLEQFIKYHTPEDKEHLLQSLEGLAGVNRDDTPRMTVEDLKVLCAMGHGVGAHSITHPILARCSDERAYQEISGSREQLESLVGGVVSSFAYPNGIPGLDFSAKHVQMVQRAGYLNALTTVYGTARSDSSYFQLPRFTPWGTSALKIDLQFARNFFKRSAVLR